MEGYLGHNSSSNIHHYTCIINHSSLHYPILYPMLFLPYWSFNIHHRTFIILLAQFIINHYTIQYSCLYSFFIINYSTFTIPTCIFFHQPSSILYAKASIMYSIFIQYSTCCNLYVTCKLSVWKFNVLSTCDIWVIIQDGILTTKLWSGE